MHTECNRCGELFNDEFHSTICPHKGIGFCRRCDCVICVCEPNQTIGEALEIKYNREKKNDDTRGQGQSQNKRPT